MIFTTDLLEPLYDLVEDCHGVEQDEKWHPEGDVEVHSFQVLHHALRESNDTDLILAAFCHDVGKSVQKLGHEKYSYELVRDLVSVKSAWLISQHMRVWTLLNGEMRKRAKAVELLQAPFLPELIALARWDKMGRKAHFRPYISPEDLVDRLNEKAELHFKERPKL